MKLISTKGEPEFFEALVQRSGEEQLLERSGPTKTEFVDYLEETV